MKKEIKFQSNLSKIEMLKIKGGDEILDEQIIEETTDEMASIISNILKTKHDTAKNSVGNVR